MFDKLDTVNVSGKDIKAAVTDDCAVLTVIDWQALEGESLTQSLRHGGLDVKEHDSFMDAIDYLKGECVAGDWDRVYIINPERLRYREDKKAKS